MTCNDTKPSNTFAETLAEHAAGVKLPTPSTYEALVKAYLALRPKYYEALLKEDKRLIDKLSVPFNVEEADRGHLQGWRTETIAALSRLYALEAKEPPPATYQTLRLAYSALQQKYYALELRRNERLLSRYEDKPKVRERLYGGWYVPGAMGM